jgi:hypothetical protein
MKAISIILLIVLSLVPLAIGHAQTTVTTIDSLVIELWPDYDKPSVLVLLTGTLPFDTDLPATVTLPLPENAQFHVVARIDSKDGVMKDDIFSSPAPPDAMTFITPDLRFRLEFYLPYTVNDNQRSFDYTWLSNLSVNESSSSRYSSQSQQVHLTLSLDMKISLWRIMDWPTISFRLTMYRRDNHLLCAWNTE